MGEQLQPDKNRAFTIDRRAAWADEIPAEEWAVYRRVIAEARARGLRFALGGAFAIAAYTGNWRNTKDLDLYVLPEERHAMIDLLTGFGLKDYYGEKAYDRRWIYRSFSGSVIVDVIWAMANQRSQVDDAWLVRGPEIDLRGELVRVVPPEEMMWAKLYILQRDRCDWPDVMNLMYHVGPGLDWDHLIGRLDEDVPLLAGALSVFGWLFAARARMIPDRVWESLNVPKPRRTGQEKTPARIGMVDARLWFRHKLP